MSGTPATIKVKPVAIKPKSQLGKDEKKE